MKFLSIIALSIFMPFTLSAQTVDDWRLIFYESGADVLTIVTAEGVTGEITLPEGLPRPEVATPMRGLVNDLVRLSHDESQLAILDRESGQIKIADLEAETCCTTIALGDYLTETSVPGLVDFHPEGGQLAMYFVNTDDDAPDASAIGILIFSVDGELIQQIDAERLSDGYVCRIENHPNGWRDEGIYYAIPMCTHPGFMTHRWEPDSDEVDLRVGSSELGFRDELRGVGEVVHVAYNEDYPLVDSGPVFSNVIIHETAEDERIIFATGTYTVLPRVYWVNGGDRIAMQLFEGGALLLDRQGQTQEIPGETLEDFFGLTGSGWLSWADARILRHYSPNNLAGETLVDFGQPATLVGRDFSDYVPTVAERFPLVEPIVCEGPLPMILEAGILGQALPGGELTVYTEASIDSEVVGTLTSDRAFWILGGPICAENPWWNIQYEDDSGQQLYGWIRESSGSEYLTER